ncbi:hypothetical protein Bbelb_124940 [Branchiostoma belcheri]|nr:hypothetical protein Bbelb_124940 [Branchiostoma belcheri]
MAASSPPLGSGTEDYRVRSSPRQLTWKGARFITKGSVQLHYYSYVIVTSATATFGRRVYAPFGPWVARPRLTASYFGSQTSIGPLAVFLRQPRALRSPIAGELIPRGVGRPDASPAACVGRRTESSRARVRALGSPSPTQGLPRCASLRRQTLVAEGTDSLLRRLRRAFCRRERVKPSGYSTLARSGGFARLMRSGVRGGHKDTVALARCRVYAFTVNAFTPHAFTVHAFTVHAFTVHAFTPHAFTPHAFTVHAFTVHAFTVHAFTVPVFTVHAFTPHAFTPHAFTVHAFTVHAFTVHAFTVHAFTVHAFTVHAFTVHDTVDSSDTLVYAPFGPWVARPRLTASYFGSQTSIGPLAVFLRQPRALRSPIAGELIPRGVGRPDASPAACVGRRTESSRARVRALGSPSPTHGLPRCASLRRQTLVAEGTASLLRRLRRAFCRRERVKPSGYSTLARSGGFARLMRSGVRGGHKDTVALARCRVYAFTVNAFTPHAFTVHAFTVHAFTVHAFTPHAFTPHEFTVHAFTVHAFTVHAFTVHAFTVPVFTVHAFTPHAFTPHAFTPHAFTVHAFTVHAFTVHAFTVHAFTVHDTVDSSDTLVYAPFGPWVARPRLTASYFGSQTSIGPLAVFLRQPRALRSPIAGELIPRGVGRPDASPAACVGRRTESSRARVRALGSPSPTHGLPRCASLRRQTLVAEGTASLLRRLRRAFCRRERVKPSGYSTLARSGGFARLMRSGVRGGHKDTVALARCRAYAFTVNAFTPHAFTVHAFTVHAFTVHAFTVHAFTVPVFTVYAFTPHAFTPHAFTPHAFTPHAFTVHAFTPHAFTPHAFTVHAFTVHAFTVHAFTVPVFTVYAFTPHAFTPHAFTPHAFTPHAFTVHAFTVHAFTVHAFTVPVFTVHAFTPHAFTPHAFTVHAFTVHAFTVHAFTVHAFTVHDTVDSSDTLVYAPFGPWVARPRLTASYFGSQTSIGPLAVFLRQPRALRSPIAGELIPRGVGRPDASPAACVGRRTESSRARVRALGSPSPTHGLPRCASLRRQTLVAEGTDSLLRRLRRAFCRRERVKPSGYSTLARSGGFARLMRSGVRGGHKDTVALARCRVYAFTVNAFTPHAFTVHAFTVHAFTVHAFTPHAFTPHAFTVHAFTVHAFTVHAFTVPVFTVHAFTPHAFTPHAFTPHAFTVHAFTVHAFTVHAFTVHAFTEFDRGALPTFGRRVYAPFGPWVARPRLTASYFGSQTTKSPSLAYRGGVDPELRGVGRPDASPAACVGRRTESSRARVRALGSPSPTHGLPRCASLRRQTLVAEGTASLLRRLRRAFCRRERVKPSGYSTLARSGGFARLMRSGVRGGHKDTVALARCRVYAFTVNAFTPHAFTVHAFTVHAFTVHAFTPHAFTPHAFTVHAFTVHAFTVHAFTVHAFTVHAFTPHAFTPHAFTPHAFTPHAFTVHAFTVHAFTVHAFTVHAFTVHDTVDSSDTLVYAPFGPWVARPRLTASYFGSQTSIGPLAVFLRQPRALRSPIAGELIPRGVGRPDASPAACVGRRTESSRARVRALGSPSPTHGLPRCASLRRQTLVAEGTDSLLRRLRRAFCRRERVKPSGYSTLARSGGFARLMRSGVRGGHKDTVALARCRVYAFTVNAFTPHAFTVHAFTVHAFTPHAFTPHAFTVHAFTVHAFTVHAFTVHAFTVHAFTVHAFTPHAFTPHAFTPHAFTVHAFTVHAFTVHAFTVHAFTVHAFTVHDTVDSSDTLVYAPFGPWVARPRLTASYFGSQTSIGPLAVFLRQPRALRSPIAGELIPRGVGRPDASPAACVGRRTESSRARVRALGSPSPTHGLPRCASLRRQTLVAEGTDSLLRRLRRAFCRRERVKPSGYSTLARSGGFARLMRSGVRGGHKDTVALARCRVYAFTVNAFTPHAFTVHAFTVHAFTVHAFTPHAFTPHAFTVHAFTVHAFTVHAFTVHAFTVHAFTPHAFTPHAFTLHAFTVHAFTVHALCLAVPCF